MVKCFRCGTMNYEAAQFCDRCGNKLQQTRILNVVQPEMWRSQHSIMPPEKAELQPESNNPQTASPNHHARAGDRALSPPNFGKTGAVAQNEASRAIESVERAAPHARLVVERGKNVGKEFVLNTGEVNIGRWDADNGIFPDVDLDADDPEAKVSRRHARITRVNDQYLIEDLGSTNGTFVNRGRRLIIGNQQILSDNDEIIVGKTFLRFQIVR